MNIHPRRRPGPTVAVFALAVLTVLAGRPPARAAEVPPAGPTGVTPANVIIPRLAVSEKITVNVVGEDYLNITTRVDPDGKISLKYLDDDVTVAGLTIPEAEAAIARAYIDGRILRKPEVKVVIEESIQRTAIVRGQVNSPGRIALPSDTRIDIVDLLSRAGGLTLQAKGSAVTITRAGKDGKPETINVDVEGIMKGKIPRDQAPMIMPDDIVDVPIRIL